MEFQLNFGHFPPFEMFCRTKIEGFFLNYVFISSNGKTNRNWVLETTLLKQTDLISQSSHNKVFKFSFRFIFIFSFLFLWISALFILWDEYLQPKKKLLFKWNFFGWNSARCSTQITTGKNKIAGLQLIPKMPPHTMKYRWTCQKQLTKNSFTNRHLAIDRTFKWDEQRTTKKKQPKTQTSKLKRTQNISTHHFKLLLYIFRFEWQQNGNFGLIIIIIDRSISIHIGKWMNMQFTCCCHRSNQWLYFIFLYQWGAEWKIIMDIHNSITALKIGKSRFDESNKISCTLMAGDRSMSMFIFLSYDIYLFFVWVYWNIYCCCNGMILWDQKDRVRAEKGTI